MKIHEYQAKQLLRKFDVPVLGGGAARTAEDAVAIAATLPGAVWVVKAQIHAGGRGLGRLREEVSADDLDKASRGEKAAGAGGVRLARSAIEVGNHAAALLGKTLVTKQTGIEGKKIRTVFVEAGCDIGRELYLAMLLDRAKNRLLLMASAEGGVTIEETAAHNPDAIHKAWIDPVTGLSAWQARKMAFALGMTGKEVNLFAKFAASLYRAYCALDASMIEINPLVITKQGDVVALDAKMSFDDNALFRHPELIEMRDLHEEDPSETEAAHWNLSYVKLDGNIGCLVNGAGLAMSTMDIIKYYGAEPANFLDVGGGANAEQVTAAFRIITRDPSVKGILVNIFGGIMKGDTIANGVVTAVKEVGLTVPLVVRLVGTNADIGRKILADSGLNVKGVTSLDEAASAIVAAVKEA